MSIKTCPLEIVVAMRVVVRVVLVVVVVIVVPKTSIIHLAFLVFP